MNNNPKLMINNKLDYKILCPHACQFDAYLECV